MFLRKLSLYFIRQTNFPIISFLLFFTTLVLNSIQYTNAINLPSYSPLWVILDLIGVNGFIINGILLQLFLYVVALINLSLVELWVGSFWIFFFLLMDVLYQIFISILITGCDGHFLIRDPPYCCGSFIMVAALGSVLYIIHQQKSIWMILFFSFVVILSYDYFVQFKNTRNRECKFILWHGPNYLLGILCISIYKLIIQKS